MPHPIPSPPTCRGATENQGRVRDEDIGARGGGKVWPIRVPDLAPLILLSSTNQLRCWSGRRLSKVTKLLVPLPHFIFLRLATLDAFHTQQSPVAFLFPLFPPFEACNCDGSERTRAPCARAPSRADSRIRVYLLYSSRASHLKEDCIRKTEDTWMGFRRRCVREWVHAMHGYGVCPPFLARSHARSAPARQPPPQRAWCPIARKVYANTSHAMTVPAVPRSVQPSSRRHHAPPSDYSIREVGSREWKGTYR
ncbi:hypothetical protein B0H14DRAFT_3897782, partial [Mycena olivaceomarginata]